ncbi:MAG TPA: hypothetical protein VIB78_00370 [Acidimicrobiia bacterium]
MARYVCDNCGATVVDEEFCPTCGSWVDTLGKDEDEYEEFDLEEGPPPPRTARGEPTLCPSCGAPNPSTNRHCEECGARLRQGPLPTAPRPAVQSTAGVRALGALFGLIALVVIIAVLINLINGDDETTATTLASDASTTTAGAVQVENPAPLDILTASCVPEGLGGDFSCTNLIDGNAGSFQVNYNELPEGEKEVEIRLTFPQPMEVTRIIWLNLEDEARFRRNYRAKGITIEAEGNPFVVPQELQDAPGEQGFDFATIRANFIVITVQSVYQAEVVEGTEPFDELAIEEITIVGRPAETATNTTSTDDTTTTTGG